MRQRKPSKSQQHRHKVMSIISTWIVATVLLTACVGTSGENNTITPKSQKTNSLVATQSKGTPAPTNSPAATQTANTTPSPTCPQHTPTRAYGIFEKYDNSNPEVTFKGKPLLVVGDSNTDERNPKNIVNTMRLDHFTCIGCSANELAVQALGKESLRKQLESGKYVGVIFIGGSTNPQEGTKNLVELFECLKSKNVELFGVTSFVPGHVDKQIQQDWRTQIELINKVIREYSGARILDMQSKVESKTDPWQGPWETSRIGLNNEQDGNHYNDRGLEALRQEIIKWFASMR